MKNNMNTDTTANQYSDEELIKNLPGFSNHYINVNGITLHYAEGGQGSPLICLPGWPQTWYSYHPIARQLATRFRVIIVDLRGMGSSGKPLSGYDKKTMATDIAALITQLGLGKVHVMGHDIGGMVAMSLAFNSPQYIEKLIVADGAHPNEGMLMMPLIPAPGTFGAKMDATMPYAWWMGFNQVKGLPEQLLQGRFHYLLDYLFDYVMIDPGRMTAFERAVYAAAYNEAESIRAANAWYQAFGEDIADSKTYQQLTMPVLALGSNVSYNYMNMYMPNVASDVQVTGLLDSGHYMFEEKPEHVVEELFKFLL